jgi:hypothetical protein
MAGLRLQVKDRLVNWCGSGRSVGLNNTRDNRWALILCLIIILLVILTADQSPQWIYQGF